jgi:hypothetical protein
LGLFRTVVDSFFRGGRAREVPLAWPQPRRENRIRYRRCWVTASPRQANEAPAVFLRSGPGLLRISKIVAVGFAEEERYRVSAVERAKVMPLLVAGAGRRKSRVTGSLRTEDSLACLQGLTDARGHHHSLARVLGFNHPVAAEVARSRRAYVMPAGSATKIGRIARESAHLRGGEEGRGWPSASRCTVYGQVPTPEHAWLISVTAFSVIVPLAAEPRS